MMAHSVRDRLLRPRLRTLMVAVALVAIPLAAWATIGARRDRFRRLATHHRSLVVCIVTIGRGGGPGVLNRTPSGRVVGEEQVDLDLWHLGLSEKYRKAVERPWLPVPADPEPPGTSDRSPGSGPAAE